MATAAKKPGTSVVKWDEELAKEAAVAAKMEESTLSSQIIKTRGGLSLNDLPIKDNEMAVIIADSILENAFYEGAFDPDSPQGPVCFAFGRDEDEMKPHEKSASPQHETCTGCPMNEWGSADTGRGKACKNSRRLGILSAGSFDNGKFKPIMDKEHFEKTTEAFVKLPVTSVKGYAAFVKQLASALKRPPFAVFSKIKWVTDPQTQFKLVFEALDKVPDILMPVIMERHHQVGETIDFPYQAPDGGFEQQAKPEGKPAAKEAAKKPVSNRPPVKRAAAKY